MMLPKVEIRKILYTTDLSESARHAFAYAASLANLYGAGITILHVLTEDPGMSMGIISYIGEKRWEDIRKRNEEYAKQTLTGKRRDNIPLKDGLEQFCEDVKADIGETQTFITDEILVLRGNPADIIIEESEKRNCDLIVMGTHGHGIIADAVMGSTARQIMRRSRKPVLVIRLPNET
jgi:nucleotide-binding universal stress UspA family protein